MFTTSFFLPRAVPELFDSKVVFRDDKTESFTKPRLDLSRSEGKKLKKAKAEGYPETQPYSLFNRVPVSEFFKASDVHGHLDVLASANALHFDDDPEVANHPLTTDLVKEYCSDLKVKFRCHSFNCHRL
jgi:hypothetical protein